MKPYPFDQKFIATIERLFEDDSGWVTQALLQCENARFENLHKDYTEKLETAGYSRETVRQYMLALRSMPINDLIELAVQDQDNFSPACVFLELQDSRKVFDRLKKLCSSKDPWRRVAGIEIMMRVPGHTFHTEATEIVCGIAERETDERVQEALAWGLCHLSVHSRSKYLVKWSTSNVTRTRFAVAYSLGGLSTKGAIKSLITLSRDHDDKVRDWATFGLGDMTDVDTWELRDALCERLNDSHDETRHEAIFGLAKRRDMRVLKALTIALRGKSVWHMAIDAAKELEEPALLPLLLKIKKKHPDCEQLAEAIEACKAAAIL